jgi:hypothetical protein
LVGFEEGRAAENLRAKRHEIIGDEGGGGGGGGGSKPEGFKAR